MVVRQSVRPGIDTGARLRKNPGLVPKLPFVEDMFPGLKNVRFSRQRFGELFQLRLWRLQRQLSRLPARAGSQHHQFLQSRPVHDGDRMLHVLSRCRAVPCPRG